MMLCWSCGSEMPDRAQFCPHCEAPAEEPPSPEEKALVSEMLAALGPEAYEQLRDAFENSATGEEFVARIMIGDCPRCGGSQTSDCENDPDIDDVCVGRCFACGQLWCLDCGELFPLGKPIEHDCPVWQELLGDEFDD